MDLGIRAVWYDLPEQGRDEFLQWLHEDHLPKVLQFPGIAWAAHYEIPGGDNNVSFHDKLNRPEDDAVGTGSQFIVMAGATTPHVFFDPSPAQIAEGETTAYQEMASRRIGVRPCIFSEVVRIDGPEAGQRLAGTTPGPAIQMGSFRTSTVEEEMDAGAWYTQYRLPAIAKMPGAIGARRLACIAGWPKHGVLYEYTSLEARLEHFQQHESLGESEGEWTNRVITYTIHSPGSPSVARRIWPPVED
jgi:hypothetical protein